jgi:hypothetical protein
VDLRQHRFIQRRLAGKGQVIEEGLELMGSRPTRTSTAVVETSGSQWVRGVSLSANKPTTLSTSALKPRSQSRTGAAPASR